MGEWEWGVAIVCKLFVFMFCPVSSQSAARAVLLLQGPGRSHFRWPAHNLRYFRFKLFT